MNYANQANPIEDKIYSLFASCAKGIELLLKDELLNLGALSAQEKLAGVMFEASLSTSYKICLHSRLANQVQLKLNEFKLSLIHI